MLRKGSFNILIADDDLDDQKLMKEGLDKCTVDVRIDSVYDGVQVLDYLNKKGVYRSIRITPDLVLLDLNMPLMDGFDVLKEVKKHPHLCTIPIYVITTSRDADHMKKALKLGANGFYSKGSKSEEIVRIMKEVCAECFETPDKYRI
jgi:two-component system, response regulator